MAILVHGPLYCAMWIGALGAAASGAFLIAIMLVLMMAGVILHRQVT